MAAPTTTGPARVTAGHWVSNGGKWQLIHAVGLNKWAAGPKPGFGAPAKPSGSAVNPLAPLTNQQITKQATSEIGSAYKPVFTDLTNQSSQAQAIYDKQQADNEFYQNWLDTKTAALTAQQNQTDASTNALEQQLTQDQLGQYSGQANTLISQANARAGNVSNNATSTPINQGLAQNQAATENQLGTASQSALAGEQNARAGLNATIGNTGNAVQAGASKELSNLNTTLTKIAQVRTVDQQKMTGDIAKEIARLNTVEVQKALDVQNQKIAAEKLGVSAANVNSEINTRAANSATSRMNAQTNLTREQQTTMNQDRTYQLNLDKYNTAVAKDLYERDNGLGPYKNARNAPLSQVSQNAIYSRIAKTSGELTSLVNQGFAPKVAYQILLSGHGKTSSGKAITVPREDDQGLLNAAYNTSVGGKGLSSGDVKYLERYGLSNIGKRLHIAITLPQTIGGPPGPAGPAGATGG